MYLSHKQDTCWCVREHTLCRRCEQSQPRPLTCVPGPCNPVTAMCSHFSPSQQARQPPGCMLTRWCRPKSSAPFPTAPHAAPWTSPYVLHRLCSHRGLSSTTTVPVPCSLVWHTFLKVLSPGTFLTDSGLVMCFIMSLFRNFSNSDAEVSRSATHSARPPPEALP